MPTDIVPIDKIISIFLPVNIIAYRSQYGSGNPAGIVGPAIIATLVSALTGVVFAKIMGRRSRRIQ